MTTMHQLNPELRHRQTASKHTKTALANDEGEKLRPVPKDAADRAFFKMGGPDPDTVLQLAAGPQALLP